MQNELKEKTTKELIEYCDELSKKKDTGDCIDIIHTEIAKRIENQSGVSIVYSKITNLPFVGENKNIYCVLMSAKMKDKEKELRYIPQKDLEKVLGGSCFQNGIHNITIVYEETELTMRMLKFETACTFLGHNPPKYDLNPFVMRELALYLQGHEEKKKDLSVLINRITLLTPVTKDGNYELMRLNRRHKVPVYTDEYRLLRDYPNHEVKEVNLKYLPSNIVINPKDITFVPDEEIRYSSLNTATLLKMRLISDMEKLGLKI